MRALHAASNEPLQLAGDGRFDSPGHSSLYGLYTMMDMKTSKIVASELVKVRHANSK